LTLRLTTVLDEHVRREPAVRRGGVCAAGGGGAGVGLSARGVGAVRGGGGVAGVLLDGGRLLVLDDVLVHDLGGRGAGRFYVAMGDVACLGGHGGGFSGDGAARLAALDGGLGARLRRVVGKRGRQKKDMLFHCVRTDC